MMTAYMPARTASRRALALMFVLGLLVACGGVGEEGTDEQAVNVGVLQEIDGSSLTVNGVSYYREQAVVTNGFGDVVGERALRLGMWLEIYSTDTNDQGQSMASRIRIRPSARGTVTGVDADTLSVSLLSATVRYNGDSTVLAGVDSVAALSAGDMVEVHGPLGADDGIVEASRLAKLSREAGAPRPIELRGRVRRLNQADSTMRVGRQPVDFSNASVTLRRALNNGQVVRVSASQEPIAGQTWIVNRLTADQALPDNLGFAYAQGVVTNLQAGPLFALEDLQVDAGTANNRGRVTSDGQRVAVIGAIRDGIFKAKSVAVITPGQPATFVLGGALMRFESVASFRVRGVEINASIADFANGTAAELADSRRIRVTGRMVGRRLVASRVVFLD